MRPNGLGQARVRLSVLRRPDLHWGRLGWNRRLLGQGAIAYLLLLLLLLLNTH